MGIIGIGLYVFYRWMMKEPILPWKEKKKTQNASPKSKNKTKKKQTKTNQQNSKSFRNLISKLHDIRDHMLILENNQYVAVVEVSPVNYFLLSQDEQEAIDMKYETWLSQCNYPVFEHLQNRFVDLSEPIENIEKTMEEDEDLTELTREYGQSMIENLNHWQNNAPRYETKRYIVFPYQLESKDIEADDEQEFQEKADQKAFNELFRRMNTAQNTLSKADMQLHLLSTEGLIELLYYTLNRRKATKNKIKDIRNQENLSLYVTAEQSETYIAKLKEELKHNGTDKQVQEGQNESQAG